MSAPDAEVVRPCSPEWCESGGEPHDDVCDNAPMHAMTKHEFVEFMEAAGRHAIDSYRFMAEEDDMALEEAIEIAVEEVNELATCYAGIGSCGRGWCHHG